MQYQIRSKPCTRPAIITSHGEMTDTTERSRMMGDKGGKKGKDKSQKQKVAKHQQDAKKKLDKQKKSERPTMP